MKNKTVKTKNEYNVPIYTEKERWEIIINHPSWEGTKDINLLISLWNIDDAEQEMDNLGYYSDDY